MRREGVSGIKIIQIQDGVRVTRDWGDSIEEFFIPFLNDRNSWVVSVYNSLKIIPGMNLMTAIETLGLKISRVEMYLLIKKIQHIENRIESREKNGPAS